MSGVDELDGTIAGLEERSFKDVARGFTYFEEGDVLFAKITPCMQNGKCIVTRGLCDRIGFGSTEFHVLRPSSRLIADWVHRFLRRLAFRLEAKEHFRGAVGQQRVPEDFLASSLIPVPPSLDIQRRIVARIEALLAEVKEARALAAAIRRDTDRVMGAAVEEMFDNLEHRKVEHEPLGSLLRAKPQYGLSEKASDSPPGVPILRMGNIVGGEVRLNNLKFVELSPAKETKYLVGNGDILFNRTNSAELVGKSAVYEGSERVVFASYLIRLVADQQKARPRFLVTYINSLRGRTYIQSQLTRAIGQVNVNAQKLAAMLVPVPDLKEQDQVCEYLAGLKQEVDEMRRLQAQDAELLDQLEQSILERAFRGEL